MGISISPIISVHTPTQFFCTFNREIPVTVPPCDGPLTTWWDAEADKNLLIGTYRHGYEAYDMMRVDPQLMFLKICGPPDEDEMIAAQAKPMNKINATDLDQDENSKA